MLKKFIKNVSLSVLGMLGISGFILADTFFVSDALGTDGLAALNIALPVVVLISATGLMIGIGGGIRYSILGSDFEQKKSIFTHSILIATVIAIFFQLAGVFTSKHISLLFGADEATLAMTNIYIFTYCLFSPGFILNNTLLSFVRNEGSPKIAMMAMLSGSFSNIALDYLFIYPLSMGMLGAALATGISSIISIMVLSPNLLSKKNNLRLIKDRIVFAKLIDIVSLGLTSFVTEFSSGIVLLVFNLIILNIQGNVGIAAYGIVANIALVVIAIFTGLAQGIQPIISTEYGEKNLQSVEKILKYAVITSLLISLSIYIIIFKFSDIIIFIFNHENDVKLASLAAEGLKIYCLGFFFAGINIVFSSYLSSIERLMKSFIISILRGMLIIIPAVALLSMISGMIGVWSSFVLTEVIVFASILKVKAKTEKTVLK